MPSKVSDETIHPFPNFKSATGEFEEWISNLIPQSMMAVIICPYYKRYSLKIKKAVYVATIKNLKQDPVIQASVYEVIDHLIAYA